MWAATVIAGPAPYFALIPAATASQASCLRLDITTFAPCSAIASAIALPMPRDDPVISAIWPFMSNRFMLRPRSEEHTSELQSLMRISYAVFCLTKKTELQVHSKSHTSYEHYKR